MEQGVTTFPAKWNREEENKCWGGENLDTGILPTTLTKPIPPISFCTISKKVFFAREDFCIKYATHCFIKYKTGACVS